ncbi:MAG: NAD-binding protein, partial [Phycisphaeraceae bacterium]|nr:NAD-binding protein [Phycisphaeraceae bacterium]
MDIVICGAGEVGSHSAEEWAEDGANVTLIDRDPARVAEIEATMDVRVLEGNATQAEVLLEAGCAHADLFIAATNVDEVNLLAASVAKGVGAGRCIARVHHSAYFERRGLDYARHLGIDHLVCPEHATASAIAQMLRNPAALAVERFARGVLEMQQLPVSPDAPAAGTQLRELKLPGSMRMAAITRDDEAFIPDAGTTIEVGDIVTVVGEVSDHEKGRKLFQTDSPRRVKVLIMGGSAQGVWLC